MGEEARLRAGVPLAVGVEGVVEGGVAELKDGTSRGLMDRRLSLRETGAPSGERRVVGLGGASGFKFCVTSIFNGRSSKLLRLCRALLASGTPRLSDLFWVFPRAWSLFEASRMTDGDAGRPNCIVLTLLALGIGVDC